MDDDCFSLLLIKKLSSSFVWSSQGAIHYSHRNEWLEFADCRHIFYFSFKISGPEIFQNIERGRVCAVIGAADSSSNSSWAELRRSAVGDKGDCKCDFRIEVSSVAEKGIGYVIDTDGHRGRDPEHARNMKCNRERERGQQGGRSERQSWPDRVSERHNEWVRGKGPWG